MLNLVNWAIDFTNSMVKLKRKPVRVIIEDVYLLVSPKIIQDYDLEGRN